MTGHRDDGVACLAPGVDVPVRVGDPPQRVARMVVLPESGYPWSAGVACELGLVIGISEERAVPPLYGGEPLAVRP
jgi:hypothetical protein